MKAKDNKETSRPLPAGTDTTLRHWRRLLWKISRNDYATGHRRQTWRASWADHKLAPDHRIRKGEA